MLSAVCPSKRDFPTSVNKNSREYLLAKYLCNRAVEKGLIEELTEEQKLEHRTRRHELLHKRGGFNYYGPKRRYGRDIFGRYATMTPTQKSKFIEVFKLGANEAVAAEFVGVTLTVVHRTKQDDPEFKDMIKHADEFKKGKMLELIYGRAITGEENGDHNAAASYLKLRMENESRRRNYRLKKKEVDSKVQAIGHIVNQSSASLNFRSLTNEEFKEYSLIYAKLSSGETIEPDEAVRFAILTGKLAASSDENALAATNGQNKISSVKALNGISGLDHKYSEIEEDDDD
jgi:hypothetical protein